MRGLLRYHELQYAMEPITHFLTGACIGRAGLNRKTAYATLAAVLAAEAADLDIVWGFAGPVEELKHHRGITHTFIAVPFIAAAAVGATWLYYRCIEHRRARRAKAAPPPEPGAPTRPKPQPVRWFWVYLAAIISSLSHILLDWTNNYGVRPFYPFNPRWYAGSFVFIAEPALWILLSAALIVPGILGLAEREISSKRTPFRGRNWAIFALVGMFLVWCLRYAEHAQAEDLIRNNPITTVPVDRIGVEPYPWNPFHWHVIVETQDFYQFAEVNTRTGDIDSDPQTDQLFKPPDTSAVEAAKQTELGKVYLDWGRWAVVQDIGQVQMIGIDPPQLPPGRTWTTVQFSDLRFGYDFRGNGGRGPRGALGGAVYIIDNREDGGQEMGGHEQK
ncbi:MAG: metal-dependent hydrolase [Terracidiphilus sp.]